MKFKVKYEKKKILVLCSMLALIGAVSVVNSRLSADESLNVSSGYADYEVEQMRLHDGEVLVDSANLAELPGASIVTEQDAEAQDIEDGAAEETWEETAMVASDDIAELSNTDSLFADNRANWKLAMNDNIAMLSAIIDEAPEGASRDNAVEQKLRITEYLRMEDTIENLVMTKGFTDCVVMMTDNSVTVTVNKQDLDQSDAAKILDIVMRETGRSADQVVIQTKF